MLPPVYEELASASDVTAYVEDRIYRHGEAPEGTTGNYITWFLVVGTPENTLDEPPRIDSCLIQVDCWGNNEGTGDEDVETLATAVRDTIENAGHEMNAIVVNGKDPETNRYRIGMTFTWWLHRA